MFLFNYKTYFFGLTCILVITHPLPIANSTLTLKTISGEELVAYWKFDEGIGTLAYDLSGKNDATIYGATYVTDKPGKIGYALEFNRPKQTYIETTLIQMSVQTISLWFKMNPNQLGGPIASSHIRNDDQGNFVINAKYADECGLIIRGIDGWDPPNLCAGSGPNEYADDIWHHLAFSSNKGDSVKIRIK